MNILVGYLLLFLVVGIAFLLISLLIGKLIRPRRPNPEKAFIYECGEPSIGSSWIQFDLRFYVVALLFVIFDVEVAFFFPWAVVFGKANALAKPSQENSEKDVLTQQEFLLDKEKPFTQATRDAAGRYGWLAFCDILVFFGVLLVGFAYLWSRGDLKWVRSLSAEERGPPAEEPCATTPDPPLVSAER
jgi:NADH-quinone oxidoreductase subunit A